MRSESLPLGLTVLVGVAAIARVALAWDRLPATMASHFDAAGQPDGWMYRGAFFVLFALVLGGSCMLMALLPALVRRMPPALINIPHREHWLAPQRREKTLARIASPLAWYALAYTLFLGVVLELTLQANLRGAPLASGIFYAALLAFLLATAVLVVQLHRRFRRPPSSPLEELRGAANAAPRIGQPRFTTDDRLWEKDPPPGRREPRR